ncbi:TolB family protein, partial [Bacteroidota bacterium]
VEREEDGWSDPESVGDDVNSMFRHWQVSVSSNYNLYFRADKESVEEPGIYVSKYIDGEYQKPERLPDEINSGNTTPYDPYSPYIAPDESYIIFVRTMNETGDDLFISFKDSNHKWTQAVNMGNKINSPYHDLCPTVTPDGKYLFFLSQRDGGSYAYWVDANIIEKLKSTIIT